MRSLNSVMTSNNVIRDIQASRKSTGDVCSIIQRHERTHYHRCHHELMFALRSCWLPLIRFGVYWSFVLAAWPRWCSSKFSSVWNLISCFVRVQLLCSLLHFLHCLLGAFCLGNLFFDICLRILWWWRTCETWRIDCRLVVECLNQVWWMTFLFFWRVVWKYVQL